MEFQKIADVITPLLPEGWDKVKLFCHLDKASYEYFFFVKVGGDYIQCFDLDKSFNITRKELREAFNKLFQIMRDSWAEQGWSVVTVMIDSSGEFKAEYDHSDAEVGVDYKNKWKEKYLNA